MQKEIKENNCNYFYQDIAPHNSEICKKLFLNFTKLHGALDTYDLYRPCYYERDQPGEAYGYSQVGDEIKKYRRFYTTKDYTPWLYKSPTHELQSSELPPCIFGVPIVDYLNTEEVRDALHIPQQVQPWEMCTT